MRPTTKRESRNIVLLTICSLVALVTWIVLVAGSDYHISVSAGMPQAAPGQVIVVTLTPNTSGILETVK